MFHVKHNANLLFYLPPAASFFLFQKERGREEPVKLVTEMPGAPQRETVKKRKPKRGLFTKPPPLWKHPSELREMYHSTCALLLTQQRVVIGFDSSNHSRALRAGAVKVEAFLCSPQQRVTRGFSGSGQIQVLDTDAQKRNNRGHQLPHYFAAQRVKRLFLFHRAGRFSFSTRGKGKGGRERSPPEANPLRPFGAPLPKGEASNAPGSDDVSRETSSPCMNPLLLFPANGFIIE